MCILSLQKTRIKKDWYLEKKLSEHNKRITVYIYINLILIIISDLERRFSINGVNLTSVLSPWNTMTWDNFNKLEYCISHVEFGTVTENDLLFKRVINYKTGIRW